MPHLVLLFWRGGPAAGLHHQGLARREQLGQVVRGQVGFTLGQGKSGRHREVIKGQLHPTGQIPLELHPHRALLPADHRGVSLDGFLACPVNLAQLGRQVVKSGRVLQANVHGIELVARLAVEHRELAESLHVVSVAQVHEVVDAVIGPELHEALALAHVLAPGHGSESLGYCLRSRAEARDSEKNSQGNHHHRSGQYGHSFLLPCGIASE